MLHPAIHRIPTPNPFFEGDVNVWLIRGEPLTLIDTGLQLPETLEALAAGLRAEKLQLTDIERVILTHKHPDHVGLARYLVDHAQAQVWIHAADLDDLVAMESRSTLFRDRLDQQMRTWGVPDLQRHLLLQWFLKSPRLAESVPAMPLHEGDRLECSAGELTVIHTPGHTPGSISLRFHDALFVGDHVLERISPNVGAGEFDIRGMLSKYLQSLERVAACDGPEVTICPGHGATFGRLAERCHRLQQHHWERERKILDWLTEQREATVFEVATYLFGEMPHVHLMLGTGEAYVHLEKLVDEGRLSEIAPGRFRIIS